MMNKEDIAKLSELARIEMTDAEIQNFQSDIGAVLSYISEIQSVSAEEKEAPLGLVHNVFRSDENPHETGVHTDDLLGEAPQTKDGYIKVKKIL